jgi:hypothetical protein
VGGLIRRGLGLPDLGVGLGLGFPISVWRSPTAKPAAWGCRARSLPVGHRNEFCKTQRHRLPVPAVWVAEIFLGLVALFGYCDEKLIWLFGMLKFFWVWLLCLVVVMRN